MWWRHLPAFYSERRDRMDRRHPGICRMCLVRGSTHLFDLVQGWNLHRVGVAGGTLVRNGSGPAASLDDKSHGPV